MRFITDALQSIVVTPLGGRIWAIGLIVTPLLFHALAIAPRRACLPASSLRAATYIGLGCGVFLLLFRLARFGAQAFGQLFFWSVLLMMALAAAGHFGVQPIMASLKQQALPSEGNAEPFSRSLRSLARHIERASIWSNVCWGSS
jgi:hypothetical protein